MEIFEEIRESWHEEFLLPFSPGDGPLPVEPSPWIGRFFGLDANGVLRILTDDLAPIRHPSLAKFRDAALGYQPFALAHDYRRWAVGMIRREQSFLYLQSPPDRGALEDIISSYSFAEHELILEFYSHFSGLRNGPADFGVGKFVRPEEWELFESYGWEEELKRFDPERKWARSLVIYKDGQGDVILLSSTSGDTVWVPLAVKPITGPFIPFTPTFASLLDTFAELSSYSGLLQDYYRWIRRPSSSS